MDRKTVKRVKTGSFERRFSMAKAGVFAGAKYATLSAGAFFTPKDKREERRKEILSQQAQELVEELGQLKGSVVKIGQMMALFGEHFLPEEVTTALHTLESQTTAIAWRSMERHLQMELGEHKMAELDISPVPLGAASLAQVHKAVRKSDGKELVLKIQYPGVADAIDSDLRALVRLLRLSRLVPITEQFNEWLNEIRDMLLREVDYDLEAHTTRYFHDILQEDSRFVVPQVVDEFSTHNILCMTFEAGVPVTELDLEALSQQRRNYIGRAIMELCCMEVFQWNKMQTDPNFGNYLLRLDDSVEHNDKIILLDFGAIRDFEQTTLGPGREMIRGAYFRDKERLINAMRSLGFMAKNVPQRVHDDFAELCFVAIEPLQNPDRHSPSANVLNENKEYMWGNSDLPSRVMNRASRNALSIHFDVPPKEFIFLVRKLLGAYTFLHVINAEIRGNTLLEPFLPMQEAKDQTTVRELLGEK